MNNPRNRLRPGERLGEYTVRRYLDRGGFALTYLGTDSTGGRVLIKEYFPRDYAVREDGFIRPAAGQATAFGRWLNAFVREAHIMLLLSDVPGILELRDFFEWHGSAYIVTEYRPGATFSDYIDESGGRLSPEETRLIVRPVMEALSGMHDRGILHLDVSPDNVLIDKDFNVFLLDFGSALCGDDAGEPVKKDGYSPPEAYLPRPQFTETSDVYALAATVYRAVAGFAPPSAPERLHGHALAVLPREAERAVMAGLALNAADRPALSDFERLLLD